MHKCLECKQKLNFEKILWAKKYTKRVQSLWNQEIGDLLKKKYKDE